MENYIKMDDSNNELTFVRRKNRQSNYMTYNYPVIKLDVKNKQIFNKSNVSRHSNSR